jgi:predicted Zn-dependent peptidase
MSKLAKNEIYFGRHQPLQEIMEGFDQVTSKSIKNLCETLFDDRYVTLALMGKNGGTAFPTDRIAF